MASDRFALSIQRRSINLSSNTLWCIPFSDSVRFGVRIYRFGLSPNYPVSLLNMCPEFSTDGSNYSGSVRIGVTDSEDVSSKPPLSLSHCMN